MNEITKKEESTGKPRHFLYYIFQWDKEAHPMPTQKAAQLLMFLRNALQKEREDKWKDRNW